jgi:hypothetical protein
MSLLARQSGHIVCWALSAALTGCVLPAYHLNGRTLIAGEFVKAIEKDVDPTLEVLRKLRPE